jgi:propionate CoA-transferase
VVNHDGFRINESLYDDYAGMIQYLAANYYATTTRYATSAFLRLKMEEALGKRGLAPHVFERKEDAHAFLEGTDRKVRRASTAIASAA